MDSIQIIHVCYEYSLKESVLVHNKNFLCTNQHFNSQTKDKYEPIRNTTQLKMISYSYYIESLFKVLNSCVSRFSSYKLYQSVLASQVWLGKWLDAFLKRIRMKRIIWKFTEALLSADFLMHCWDQYWFTILKIKII